MALLIPSKKIEAIEKEWCALQLLAAENSLQIDDDQAHEITLHGVIAFEFFEHEFNVIFGRTNESQYPEEVCLLILVMQ